MSWNDSGGDKNQGPRNPWDRKPEGGSPDLDDIVKNLNRRIRSLFGRRGTPTTGSDGGGRYGYLLLLLVAVWLASGTYKVGPAEKAVVTRFGRFVGVTEGGMNWRLPWPIEAEQIVNTQAFLSFTDHTRMLTQDAALVEINIAVQYRRYDARAFVFNIVDPEQTLGEASESAIREAVGQSTLEAVLEKGRQDIAVRTRQLIQRTLDAYRTGLEVISVNLQDVNVPDPVAPSQKDAIKAREDKLRMSVEAQTYANQILPPARGEAQRQLLNAEAYRQQIVANAEGEGARFSQLAAAYEKAPAVTRQRLYIETMEEVLGRSTKVLLDTKGTGNTIYLPLDKLLEKRNPDIVRPATTLPDVTVTPGAQRGDGDADSRSHPQGSR